MMGVPCWMSYAAMPIVTSPTATAATINDTSVVRIR